jgi:hypothetical protein
MPPQTTTSRCARLLLGGAALWLLGPFLLALVVPHKAVVVAPAPGGAALLSSAPAGPRADHPDAEGCPVRPTFRRLASWDDWQPSNCSMDVPWVASPGTALGHSLPLFQILGEQKAGTTYLRMLLHQHPRLQAGTGLYGMTAGEPHFFDEGIRYRYVSSEPFEMARAYADYFLVHTHTRSGDAERMAFGFDTTPSYLSWPRAIPWYVREVCMVSSVHAWIDFPIVLTPFHTPHKPY